MTKTEWVIKVNGKFLVSKTEVNADYTNARKFDSHEAVYDYIEQVDLDIDGQAVEVYADYGTNVEYVEDV